MEELIHTLVERSVELEISDLVFLWFAVVMYREILKPVHALLQKVTEQIDAGSFSHGGIEAHLANVASALQSRKLEG